MKALLLCGFWAALGGALSLRADITYSEKIHYNAGTLIDMAKRLASVPMTAPTAPSFLDQTFSVYVKGNKMARVGDKTTTIIDLGAG
jgi:hypothetical protein